MIDLSCLVEIIRYWQLRFPGETQKAQDPVWPGPSTIFGNEMIVCGAWRQREFLAGILALEQNA